ncbi:MAG: MarR family transcriptional regulator [Alphaproteobacteria bacterium]|nr:MarR family transcriptional regulator [Alphaproteobacteria bacterium]
MEVDSYLGLKLWEKTLFELVRIDNNAADLSARQMAILLHIYLHEGPHTVKDLATNLNISKPAVTRALDKLSGLGFVKRHVNEKDRRIVLLERTIMGAKFATLLGDTITKIAAQI